MKSRNQKRKNLKARRAFAICEAAYEAEVYGGSKGALSAYLHTRVIWHQRGLAQAREAYKARQRA